MREIRQYICVCGSLKTLTFQTCTLLGLILQGRVQLKFNVFWRTPPPNKKKQKKQNKCYLVNIDIFNLLNSLLAMLLMSYVKMMVIKSSV